jgi:hypothetical protein
VVAITQSRTAAAVTTAGRPVGAGGAGVAAGGCWTEYDIDDSPR